MFRKLICVSLVLTLAVLSFHQAVAEDDEDESSSNSEESNSSSEEEEDEEGEEEEEEEEAEEDAESGEAGSRGVKSGNRISPVVGLLRPIIRVPPGILGGVG